MLRFDPFGGDGVQVALAQHDVVLALDLDLVAVVGAEQHLVADLGAAHVLAERHDLAPHEPLGHLGRGRDEDAAGRRALAVLLARACTSSRSLSILIGIFCPSPATPRRVPAAGTGAMCTDHYGARDGDHHQSYASRPTRRPRHVPGHRSARRCPSHRRHDAIRHARARAVTPGAALARTRTAWRRSPPPSAPCRSSSPRSLPTCPSWQASSAASKRSMVSTATRSRSTSTGRRLERGELPADPPSAWRRNGDAGGRRRAVRALARRARGVGHDGGRGRVPQRRRRTRAAPVPRRSR